MATTPDLHRKSASQPTLRARTELESLFRQALSLRMAYASLPRPEFRFQAREKLLFAAGRDVTQALSSEPDAEFVRTTRQRLLNRAGASAQEALRDVPPPRLPFWVNARRRLIETASTTPPRPAPRMPVGLRTALSAAVIVLAVAIAGAGFFLQNSTATGPSRAATAADLNYLLQQVTSAEQQQADGQTISSSLLDDLASRTIKLAENYETADPELKATLPDLIERQKDLAAAAVPDDTVAAAQARLQEADDKVSGVGSPETTSTAVTTASAATSPQTAEPTVQPAATLEVPKVVIATPQDVAAGHLVFQYDPSVTDFGLRWYRVTTSTMTFAIPESWSITGTTVDASGLAVLPSDYIFVQTDVAGLPLVISTVDGQVNTGANGQQYTLRSGGTAGSVLDAATLQQVTGGADNTASLYKMLTTITLAAAPVPTPAATSTATPSPTATATPDNGTQETNP